MMSMMSINDNKRALYTTKRYCTRCKRLKRMDGRKQKICDSCNILKNKSKVE